jgi:hypothetical protein
MQDETAVREPRRIPLAWDFRVLTYFDYNTIFLTLLHMQRPSRLYPSGVCMWHVTRLVVHKELQSFRAGSHVRGEPR